RAELETPDVLGVPPDDADHVGFLLIEVQLPNGHDMNRHVAVFTIHVVHDEVLAVRAKRNPEEVIVACKNAETLNTRGIPNPRRLISADRGKAFAIAAEGEKLPLAGKREAVEFRAVRGVPQPHRLVEAAGGDALTVRTEGDAPNFVVVLTCPKFLPLGGR